MCNLFYSLLYDLINLVVPKFKFKDNNFPAWCSKDLIECITDKKIAHAKRLDTDQDFYIEFKKLRARCIQLSRISYNEYVNKIEHSVRGNSRFFWRYVNGCRNLKSIRNGMIYRDSNNHDVELVNDDVL